MVITCVTGSNVDVYLQNVSFVIHASLPFNLDVYMQESNKIGKTIDGSCIIFYNGLDGETNLSLMMDIYRGKIKHGRSESKKGYLKEFDEHAHNIFDAVIYAENCSICRQVYLLKYMTEDNMLLPCGSCDVCEVMKGSFVLDMSYCLKKILMAVWAINLSQSKCESNTFYDIDVSDLVDLLMGNAKKSLEESNFLKEWFFASFSSWDRDILQRLVFVLLGIKFLLLNHVFDESLKNKAQNLVITCKGQKFLKSNEEVKIYISEKYCFHCHNTATI